MKNRQRKLWIAFTIVMLFSFGVLGYFGIEIYQEAPPVPIEVRTTNGEIVLTASDIKDGQNVWQSIGGQEVGSVWGHGAYVAPDWTADFLHREALYLLEYYAQEKYNKSYENSSLEEQAYLKAHLQANIRANTYDKATGVLTITEERNKARLHLQEYYTKLFTDDPEFTQLRKDYAIPNNALTDPTRLKQMNAFFFWATWATVTNRPDNDVSYTHNWPAEELVGNVATTPLIAWSGVSVILLIFAVGVLVYYHVASKQEEEDMVPMEDPVSNGTVTKSMTILKKYFWVVCLLMLLQVGLGIITAHYGVERQGLYGIPLDQILPYSVTRTWHTQLAIFWIATAWLGTGLYIAPAVGGKDPKFQVFGVNFLFIALLIIVLGSMIGQWFGIMQKLNLVQNFWFGHQGYEYVDLGRFWQIFLFVGLFVWLALMIRPLLPVLKEKGSHRNLIILFLISCGAIALFYGAGLMWGRQTNLAIAEYWRWWVVHLWVEGFFEVFATVVLAFLFVRMGLIKTKTATNGALFSTVVFMSGGIIGTFHHLYFSGTPTAVMALGATFSALEVVPLTLIGYEAYENYKISTHKGWLQDYKWPIYFMIAVAFWNFLGAGVFGFIINPPIALYYVQGLNTTPLHAHTALFGVYGMLGIGLMLFVLRSIYRDIKWNEKLLKIGFWGLNLGLLLMALLSLLPIGIWQAIESIQHGMWYARSSELMQLPAMNTLKWLRTIGDVIFTVGIFAIVLFVFKLTLKKSNHDK
ncbi:nitric-oxide reductase large subunit [Myroides odoratimimus]|uniref:nitric-oxide reductase large subunit n=1 Tax=Myroides odoratimimus TaxID=76832 RepID=UPI002577FF2A|nr:nitric-oxide reductase large subunit [Myroides odoratimimus]MDM1536880.1 nitric-oxide reductase large subunit [Myroides odoratimimus]MDM1676315.1 nitric-oxide reductase large subunit [Myroides odoratimimus]